MKAIYKIADHVLELDTLFEDVHGLFSDYRSVEKPEIKIQTNAEDILFERSRSRHSSELEGLAVGTPHDVYLEELAVYRKIAEIMPDFDTILFHGSCVAVGGDAFLFTAKSGTGKSTHTRLWREMLGERAVMVNDDKPLIRVSGGEVTVFGTPYNGKHKLGCNMSARLNAVCILERAEKNSIEPVTADSVYPKLLQQTYRPNDPERLAKTLSLLDEMASNVKLYKLRCNMDISAAKTAYNELAKQLRR